MRRICALGNTGGGILFWGVNELTSKVQGINLSPKERENIPNYIRQWEGEFNQSFIMRQRFLQARPDPLSTSDVIDLYVLRIEVYPKTDKEKFFLKIQIDGRLVR